MANFCEGVNRIKQEVVSLWQSAVDDYIRQLHEDGIDYDPVIDGQFISDLGTYFIDTIKEKNGGYLRDHDTADGRD